MARPAETTEVLFARYGPRYRIYVTVIALLGTISAIVTTTTVNVALPDIMGAFGIGQDRGQWIVTGNLAGQTVGQLLSAAQDLRRGTVHLRRLAAGGRAESERSGVGRRTGGPRLDGRCAAVADDVYLVQRVPAGEARDGDGIFQY
jgi:hypothetical protein